MDTEIIKHLIQHSYSIQEVLVKLNFNETNTTQRNKIRKFIQTHKIDISHFNPKHNPPRTSRWVDEARVRKAAKLAKSLGTLVQLMGLTNIGSNYKTAQYHIRRLNIDTSHFEKNSNGYIRGTTKELPLEEILQGNHPFYSRHSLKCRVIAAGIKENKCEECGQEEIWNNKKLVMHLDHGNGVSTDHRQENLRMLCPNCHSQTLTYAGRNK